MDRPVPSNEDTRGDYGVKIDHHYRGPSRRSYRCGVATAGALKRPKHRRRRPLSAEITRGRHIEPNGYPPNRPF